MIGLNWLAPSEHTVGDARPVLETIAAETTSRRPRLNSRMLALPVTVLRLLLDALKKGCLREDSGS